MAEAWVSLGYDERNAAAWILRLLVRRTGTDPLESTFVGVLEPHGGESGIARVRRLPLETADGEPCADAQVAVEVTLADGRQDLIVALAPPGEWGGDAEHAPQPVIQTDWELRLEGELCWARRDARGQVERMALGRGRRARLGEVEVALSGGVEFREFGIDGSLR